MERQNKQFSRFRSLAGTALAGLGILVLLGNVDCALDQLGSFLCLSAGSALGMLPCVVLAACQAMPAHAPDYQGLWGYLVRILLSFGPLLFGVGGAS